MIDTDALKASVNIVDIIAGYVPLKKSGDNYSACCPFHDERTPSFTVSESKQFYHCFGCGAHGDVITFLNKYNGWDFRQAAKSLGADIESMPLEQVRRNELIKRHYWKLPPDHKEDTETSQLGIDSGALENGHLDIRTVTGDLVNLYEQKRCVMLAGGYSYNGAHWIIKNDKPEAVAVNSYLTGRKIASIYGLNVAACFTGAVMKYICKWNNGDWKIKPVLSDQCDDYLAYDMPWLYWDGEKLTKRIIKE